MTTYTHFIPATGQIIGWQSSQDDHPGDGYLLNESDMPADASKQYVAGGVLCNYSPEESAALTGLAPGWAWKMPERTAVDLRTLDQCKAQKWASIKASREAAISAPLVTPLGTFDSDADSRFNLAGAVALAQTVGAAFSITYTLANNKPVALDAPGMVSVGLLLGAKVQAAFVTARALRVRIDAAMTADAVAAITWPAS